MKLILKINEEELYIERFRVIVDWNRMARDKKNNPVGHMNILCYMEANSLVAPTKLVLRNGCGLPKMAEQYQKIKTVVKLAGILGYDASRKENMPVLSLDKKDKYVIASIGVSVFGKDGEAEWLNTVIEAGTAWPFEDIEFTGYLVEFLKTLNVKRLDAPHQQELAHVLTELLTMFEFHIETGIDIGEEKCSHTPENTDTSTPKEK